ncbi:MAG: DUF2939 domain-containing protein [Alphaproteobacteria bacterium]
MKIQIKFFLWAALFAVVAFYIAAPYMAMQRLYDGVMRMDADVIERHVEFPALRESLKEQANAFLATRLPAGQNGRPSLFGAAGLVMLPKVVEALVDAYVTPTGMRQVLNDALVKIDGKDATGKEPRPLRREDIQYAFFENPDTFRIEAKNMVFILRLKDWKWKLTEARLPPEVFLRSRKAPDSAAPQDAPVETDMP